MRLNSGRYIFSTALVCALVALFRLVIHVNPATVALSFLVVVLLVASRWRLAHSIYLSILCTLLYNFFFLPPVGKLTIADPQNWVALSVFLATSILVSHLAENARRQRELSEQRRGEVERLYEFSQQLLMHEDMHTVARETPSIAARIFGLRAVAIYVREQDAAYYSDPGNELVPAVDLKRAAQTPDSGIRRESQMYIAPLMLGMHCEGALAIVDGGHSQQMYEAMGGLIAIALERTAVLERTSRMEAVREGERLRTALLDSVTHELRTPLTAIRAAATSLIGQSSLPDAERHEMYAIVDEESQRLDRLIGEAVEMAQLDAAGLQVRSSEQNVRELIEAVLQEEHARLRARTVDLCVPGDIPRVSMDPELVRRVLRHLIENAVKYSPAKSPIRIAVEVAGERLLVHVVDQGAGIDPAEQPFIFDKFFRGSGQRKRVEGSGLGLSIAKAILIAHDGGIEVRSEPGRGAVFTFWLPLERVV
ncbi:MAG TPA: ATP-binding protein [Pseudacidobacterium sp.]|nr:ATP-binding protein [Pseudacidobacterium sp.]